MLNYILVELHRTPVSQQQLNYYIVCSDVMTVTLLRTIIKLNSFDTLITGTSDNFDSMASG